MNKEHFIMKRIKLRDRNLPPYTRGEEIFNMVSHIVGGGFGIVALVACLIKAVLMSGGWEIASALIYGCSMIVLYTMSSLYHGLKCPTAKKVFQIIDHCTIFLLIAGTYTPVVLTQMREEMPLTAWGVFTFVWGLAILGIILNSIDLKKYATLSMVFYILMGWCVVFTGEVAIRALTPAGFAWMLWGGVAYTVGAVFYGVAAKRKKRIPYMHSVFHLFVLLGSILQFISIFIYII